jgi:hypothetical protein
MIDERLGEDAARGVAGAQEQHVVGLIAHESLKLLDE